ncbi:hypothetical protein BDR04DRAFT_1105172 [Suillus decipiens]|nr:hypothetical protein BDR04DRAFT_1105172 [Suillus decipiens]
MALLDKVRYEDNRRYTRTTRLKLLALIIVRLGILTHFLAEVLLKKVLVLLRVPINRWDYIKSCIILSSVLLSRHFKFLRV